MEGKIKIRNGRKHYLIKDGEVKYIYIYNRHRHIDIEELLKAIDNKQEVYGIKENKIFKIDNTLEKEYFEKLLKITSEWENKYYNNEILDGNQWYVKIEYDDNKLSYSGSNQYPDNWGEFENFLEYIIKNQSNNVAEKRYISNGKQDDVYKNKDFLQYSLLELTIYYVLIRCPKEKQTLFNCACVLNEELLGIYADKKNLLDIPSDEFIINYLSDIFLKLKNNDKDMYKQLIEYVIEAITYYCMKNSDQLLENFLKFIGLDGERYVINLAHIVIDYKKNANFNECAQILLEKNNNIDYFQAIDIIKECLNHCDLKNIKNIENVQVENNTNTILKLVGDNDKLYYIEIDSYNLIQSIKANTIDGDIIYKGGLDSLFD